MQSPTATIRRTILSRDKKGTQRGPFFIVLLVDFQNLAVSVVFDLPSRHYIVYGLPLQPGANNEFIQEQASVALKQRHGYLPFKPLLTN
jgi:hypothetical protein